MTDQPIPVVLHCPRCRVPHVDEGEWATKPHRTHLCAVCSHKWRPASVDTVGVTPEAIEKTVQALAKLKREIFGVGTVPDIVAATALAFPSPSLSDHWSSKDHAP